MPQQPIDPSRLDRAVVAQFLARLGSVRVPQLYAAVRTPGATSEEIDRSVARLADAGVICRDGDGTLRASAALRCLDTLKLVEV
jgi:hypothetical protein